MSRTSAVLGTALLLAAALVWLGPPGRFRSCRITTVTPDYRVVLYPIDGCFHPGDVQIGLRVQDRAYRIQTDISGVFTVTAADAPAEEETADLRPGPGRDLRGWARFPEPGWYRLRARLRDAKGNAFETTFAVRARVSHRWWRRWFRRANLLRNQEVYP